MNPSGASLPAHELSAANTMVWPRPRRMSASPMHWFVGPYADSGQNMMVSDGGVVTEMPFRSNGGYCATAGSGASVTELSRGGTRRSDRYSHRRSACRHGFSTSA